MQNSTRPEARTSLLLSLIVLGILAALVVIPAQFRSEAGGQKTGEGLITRTSATDNRFPNYDIRTEKSDAINDYLTNARQSLGRNAAAVADIREGFVRGEDALRNRYNEVKFEYNSDIRTPEVITPDVWKSQLQLLSSPSSEKRSEILRSFIKQNNELIGVSGEQADSLRVLVDETNPDGQKSYALLEQRINNIPVFRGEIKAGFTKDGQIIRVINNLAPGLDYGSLSTEFGDPLNAVKSAAGAIQHELKTTDLARNDAASSDLKVVFGEGDWATTAEKMYFPTEPGVAVPAWRVLIWQPVNAYYVIVDARDGTMLWRKNIVEDQTQSATYNVYRNSNAYIDVADSPAPLSPYSSGTGLPDPTAGTQGAIISRQNVTLVGNEGSNSFNNSGWITDNAGPAPLPSNLGWTDGNALEAGIDRDGTNGVDAPQPGTATRQFTTSSPAWNPPPGNPAPGDEPSTPQAQRGAVIQMFYVMNRYHDELYKRGFTEQWFNFQNDNFGRGGVGNDRVSGEGQDSSGTNNANFGTPADGGRGRMQMFLWTGPTPDYDGTADAEVIIHEVTHGTSNRLHGNASGLSSNMSRGMGEGWGDFFGYSLLAEPTDPINGVYTTGGYATYLIATGFTANYYYGIRRFPRAPITYLGANGKPYNPFTLKYINADCNTNIGTTTSGPNSAFPRGPIGVSTCDQVHNIGEIWSSMLWEVRNRMVTRLGFTAGTSQALQVVIDGMKMAPVGPTILQERDAIIASAATISPAAAQDVREGFRVRGAGFSADVTNAGSGSNDTVVVEAFDVPNAIIGTGITVSDSVGDNDGFPESGENVLVSVPVSNNSGNAIANVQVTIVGGGTVNYGTIADGATVTRTITYTVSASTPCGSLETITINGTSALGALNPRTYSFRVGVPVGGAPATFTNSAAITINDNAPGSPYPSDIAVSGLSGNKIIKMTLNGISHTFPADVDMLLVGPGGQKFVPVSDSGSGGDVTNLVISFTDRAAAQPNASQWVAGEFKPVNIDTTSDVFPAPAPAAPYENPAPAGTATFASAFGTAGSAMNGTWSLYVRDDAGADLGTISGGWSLTFEANDYVCGVHSSSVRSRSDFDGDGKTDQAVFRNSSGDWYQNRSTTGFSATHWGQAGDVPVPGDYDNDGKTDLAVFRAGTWFILNSATGTVSAFNWGLATDVLVQGDYDADGKTDAAVYRPSNGGWYIQKSTGGIQSQVFGQTGDTPVSGDFDGDGKADYTVFRGGVWITQKSNGGAVTYTNWGLATDKLVPADYDGDNKDDVAVFRPSNGVWYVLRSSTGTASFTTFGQSGDIPVPGDFDGDGKDDQAVYRGGVWYMNRSTSGFGAVSFGLATDTAIPAKYIP